MAMLIVNDEDFLRQVNNTVAPEGDKALPSPASSNERLIAEILPPKPLGRGKNNVEVPNALRQLIGGEYIEDRSEGVALAKEFGISAPSASAYSVGSNSTASYTDRPNAPHIKNVKQAISKRAQNKLKQALTHITEDKLAAASARDLSGVAKDMAAVVRAMEPESVNASAASQPQFVIYAPRLIEEKHLDITVINE